MSALKLQGPGSEVVDRLDLSNLAEQVLTILEMKRIWWTEPLTTSELADAVSIKKTATNSSIRRALRELNMAGYPVVVNSSGAWLADNVAELYTYRESLWQRAEEIITRTHALTNIIRRFNQA